MSVTSRLFICEQADLDRFRSGKSRADDFDTDARMNGTTSLHLCLIWAAIEGCEWDPEVHTGAMLTGNGYWIEHFPQRMVSAFTSVSDSDAGRVASNLAPTEDFGWEITEVFELIRRIRSFAGRVQERNLCMETEL